MENRYYTRLEAEIQNFISKYGVDALISWLSEYSKIVSTSDFNTFNRIQKYTCEEYGIPIADINGRGSTNPDYADAKKTITLLTYKHTKLQLKHITMVQGCTTRTVYNHVKEVEFRIENPSSFREFVGKYNKILNKLNNYVKP